MARGRKEKLTLEQLVEQAVIKEDQPYKVPNNWVWTRLENIVTILGDGLHGTPRYCDSGDYYFINGNNLNDDVIEIKDTTKRVSEEEFNKYKKNLDESTVLVSINGTLGNTAFYNNERVILGKSACYFNLVKGVEKKYIKYILQTYYFINYANKKATGSTIKNLSLKAMRNLNIPVPPVAEQQRIVDRIESLFEKLDTAKELAQNALDSFENRKAAILHKAFTGELTAKWREENGVSLESWEETTFGKFIDTKYGYTESASIAKVGPQFLRITDIQDGEVNWDNVPYCPISDNEFEKYKLNIDDIVVARTGATTGKSYIVEEKVNAVFASYLIRVNVINKERLLPKYLWSFMQSTIYWNQIMEVKKGIAQPGVNANKLKELVIHLPSKLEQLEIIRVIEGILEQQQHAQELCNVIEKIDLMKKSILARAFRGELGTNEPEEESAMELLKEVLKKKL